MWNLEGLEVSGLYMGEFPCTGVVELSRVQYGGEVSHHVVLTTPIVVFNAIRDRVILNHKNIETVRG
jgi:hypothetical protein